jgi:hypothetical protein
MLDTTPTSPSRTDAELLDRFVEAVLTGGPLWDVTQGAPPMGCAQPLRSRHSHRPQALAGGNAPHRRSTGAS